MGRLPILRPRLLCRMGGSARRAGSPMFFKRSTSALPEAKAPARKTGALATSARRTTVEYLHHIARRIGVTAPTRRSDVALGLG
jgi:hypothetical protein